MQWTENVIKALEMERNRQIASELARECVDGILQWMLEGWYFGERPSKLKVVGFVPSIRADGPISVQEAQIIAERG